MTIVSFIAAPARSEPNRPRIAFRLSYDAPTAALCPSADEVALLLASEFGYRVTRQDAASTLSIRVRRNGAGFEADLDARDVSDTPRWERHMPNQWTCRELLYDVAVLVRIAFGPRGWGGEKEPPAWLAAPMDVGFSAPSIVPARFVLVEPLAAPRPGALFATLITTEDPEKREERQTPPVQPEVALGVAASPYGMPSFALGGSGMLGVRWPMFALALDVRGLITPASGIGYRALPGRTSVWTISLLPCVRASFLDLCASANVAFMSFDLDAPFELLSAQGSTAGVGARVGARWQFADRFTLLGYADLAAQLSTIVLSLPESATAGGPPEEWRSPFMRLTLGMSIAASIGP